MNLLKIQFQTPENIQAPFSRAIEIQFEQESDSLLMDFSLEYLNRDTISLDEIEEEGFSENDNLAWKGEVPKNWLTEIHFIKEKIIVSNKKEIEEDEEFYLVEFDKKSFYPKNPELISYFIEEVMQAVFEKLELESKLKITLVKNSKESISKIELECSFFERNAVLISNKLGNETSKLLAWQQSKSFLSEIFDGEFSEEGCDLKLPSREGIFINIGTENWYQKEKTWRATRPIRFLKDL